MNPIIKPWPFRGWGMDMVSKINPPSSKGHQFILAITDYFTKWVEVVPMKLVASRDVIQFIKKHIIHRFGIPQTITTDGGSVFISKEFKKFTADMGIKLIRSSPYYAQANGQAEVSNQSLIKLIKRKIDEYPDAGTRSCQKHCGHTVYLVMGRQKLPLITWSTGRRPCYRGKLWPGQGA
jgi:transposase InsO family protein